MAEHDAGAGRSLDAQREGADGDSAVEAHADGGAQTPDERPPGAEGLGTQDRALFSEGEVPRLLRGQAELAVDLVLVVVEAQGLDVGSGVVQIGDLFTGEVGRQALPPEVMGALDLALGLGGGEAEGDPVEVQRLAQLGEGLGIVGEEEAVVNRRKVPGADHNGRTLRAAGRSKPAAFRAGRSGSR